MVEVELRVPMSSPARHSMGYLPQKELPAPEECTGVSLGRYNCDIARLLCVILCVQSLSVYMLRANSKCTRMLCIHFFAVPELSVCVNNELLCLSTMSTRIL